MKNLKTISCRQVELLSTAGLLPALVSHETPATGLAGPLAGRGGGGGGQAPLLRPPHHPCLVHDGQQARCQGQGSLLAIQVDPIVLAKSDIEVLDMCLVTGEPVSPELPLHSRPECSPTMMCLAY